MAAKRPAPPPAKRSAPKRPASSMTIDELARASGMTVRNIRAHQSRGLLPAPEVRARTGYYGPEHVARLNLIQELQGNGYNLAAISHLLAALGRLGRGHPALRRHAALARSGRGSPKSSSSTSCARASAPAPTRSC